MTNVPLPEVCAIEMGQAPKGSSYNEDGHGVPLIAGASDLGEQTPSPSRFTDSPTKICRPGDLLLCIRATIGDLNVADRDYCLGRGVAGLRAAPERLDNRYLWHWVTASADDLRSMGRGATFLQISKKDLQSLQIPLPPLPKQKRIAAILDAADALRTKRRESLKHLDELVQSVFLDMFGDPVTNPKGWDVVELGTVLSHLTSGSRGWAKYYSESGDIFLRIQNLVCGELQLEDVAYVQPPDNAEAKRTRVETDDVLLSITADLGRTAVVPDGLGKAHINQHLVILRTERLDSTFLSQFLASPGGAIQFQRLNRNGVKAGLNFTDIKGLLVLEPPINLQRKYAAMVSSIRSHRQRVENHLAELDTLFASLQSRAFRGEL